MFDCFRTSCQWFSFASPIHPLNSSIHSLNCLSKVRSGGLASTWLRFEDPLWRIPRCSQARRDIQSPCLFQIPKPHHCMSNSSISSYILFICLFLQASFCSPHQCHASMLQVNKKSVKLHSWSFCWL